MIVKRFRVTDPGRRSILIGILSENKDFCAPVKTYYMEMKEWLVNCVL